MTQSSIFSFFSFSEATDVALKMKKNNCKRREEEVKSSKDEEEETLMEETVKNILRMPLSSLLFTCYCGFLNFISLRVSFLIFHQKSVYLCEPQEIISHLNAIARRVLSKYLWNFNGVSSHAHKNSRMGRAMLSSLIEVSIFQNEQFSQIFELPSLGWLMATTVEKTSFEQFFFSWTFQSLRTLVRKL